MKPLKNMKKGESRKKRRSSSAIFLANSKGGSFARAPTKLEKSSRHNKQKGTNGGGRDDIGTHYNGGKIATRGKKNCSDNGNKDEQGKTAQPALFAGRTIKKKKVTASGEWTTKGEQWGAKENNGTKSREMRMRKQTKKQKLRE